MGYNKRWHPEYVAESMERMGGGWIEYAVECGQVVELATQLDDKFAADVARTVLQIINRGTGKISPKQRAIVASALTAEYKTPKAIAEKVWGIKPVEATAEQLEAKESEPVPKNYLGSHIDIANTITRYINDAATLAKTGRLVDTSCFYDGIRSPEQLAAEILSLGKAYVNKMTALRDANPIVRGDTISIHTPKEVSPNYPSIEDEKFLCDCRARFRKEGFLRAVDHDMYEKISRQYPGRVVPHKLRGTEGRRYLYLTSGQALLDKLTKGKSRIS